MSEINITIEGGTSKRLLTAGKFCDRDIVVTAEGGSGGAAETCTVRVTLSRTAISTPPIGVCVYSSLSNGEVEHLEERFEYTDTFDVTLNVLKDSYFIIFRNDYTYIPTAGATEGATGDVYHVSYLLDNFASIYWVKGDGGITLAM